MIQSTLLCGLHTHTLNYSCAIVALSLNFSLNLSSPFSHRLVLWKVEAQRDFHKIQGNLKIVTVTTDGDQSAASGTTQTSSTYNQHHQSPHSQQTATSVSTSSSTTFTRLRPPPPPPPSAERETSIATPPWSTAGIYTTEGVIATRRPTVPTSKLIIFRCPLEVKIFNLSLSMY